MHEKIIIQLYRFPKNEAARLQWLKNMNRINWNPNQYSALCADHFSKDCINVGNKKSRLYHGAIPTIFEHLKENDPSLCTNMRSLLSVQPTSPKSLIQSTRPRLMEYPIRAENSGMNGVLAFSVFSRFDVDQLENLYLESNEGVQSIQQVQPMEVSSQSCRGIKNEGEFSFGCWLGTVMDI